MAAKKKPQLKQSDTIEQIPLACADERAALALFEKQRWGDCPCCVHCGDTNVYTIKDRATGERRIDGRWRCRGCGKQYTVRVGQIMEDSPIPLHKWAYAFWASASSKNGVSALEMSRKVQVTYKSALFMMNRIRWAMAVENEPDPKLRGVVEVDETYIGGKPRGTMSRVEKAARGYYGRGRAKQPVMAAVQRGGDVRVRVVPNVSSENVRAVLRDFVEPGGRIMTDEWPAYRKPAAEMGEHNTVEHGMGEYVDKYDPTVHTNTIEGYFSRVKRCLNGTWHCVSREHLHRYLAHTAFMYNTRQMNDGERVEHLIKSADGRRLMAKAC